MEKRFTDKYIEELAAKYRAGSLNAEEKADFDTWYSNFSDEEFVHSGAANPELVRQRMYSRIEQGIADEAAPVRQGRFSYRMMGIAASLALVLGSVWLYTKKPEQSVPGLDTSLTQQHDIAPASTGATLTLANGKKIKLSDATQGTLAQEAGVTISKSAGGQIIYEVASSASLFKNEGAAPTSKTYNILSTAKGETYQVKLPDGSKVWLNAASSLTYTTSLLEQGKRVVKLEGEGYFEISKSFDNLTRTNRPFIVQTAAQQVEVLGTHFNISAYADDRESKTSLLEGSVKVFALASRKSAKLAPGQSAAVSGTSVVIDKQANVQEAIAWKAGKFQYNQLPIEDLMRQVERWYNVEVVYTGSIPDKTYVGTISRTLPLQKFLEILSYTGLNFKVENRRIIVSP